MERIPVALTMFDLEGVSMRYGSAEVLRSLAMKLDTGEFVAVVGPNGAGKSTLLAILAGLLRPSAGICAFLGTEAHRWNRRDFARRVAVVQQVEPAMFPFTVAEVVAMGRMPHRAGMYESPEDNAAVAKALEVTNTANLRDRDFRTLSGGERQRVLLASALAQAPDVLLLDEPSTHLDLRHQIAVHRLLTELSRKGLLVVSVTHDLNLAASHASRVLLLDNGVLRANGPPASVLRADLVRDVFQAPVELHRRASGQPWLLYGE
jgi:iron complex transport system ATP-binding protein